MKLINIYYQIKYGLNEQEDLDKLTVKNPETGNEIKVTSVLSHPEYKDKPVEKLAQQKIVALKNKNVTSNPNEKPEIPKNKNNQQEKPTSSTSKSKDKTKTEKDSKPLSVVDVANKAKAEAEKKQQEKINKQKEKIRQKTYKQLSKSVFGDEKQAKDIETLMKETDPKKRQEHLKKLKPDMKDEDIEVVSDLMDSVKQDEAFEQMQEAFPEESKKFNEKLSEAGLNNNDKDNSLDNKDGPTNPEDKENKKVSKKEKAKKIAKKVGIGLVVAPAALLGLGVIMAGGVVGSAFGLASKFLDMLTEMAKSTGGSYR